MKQLFANNAKTTLASPITANSTGLVVADGSKFPVPGANEYFLVTLELSGQIEIVMITSRVGNVMQIGGYLEYGQSVPGRGQEASTARAFSAGTKVECRITKNTLDRVYNGFATASDMSGINSPAVDFQEGYVIQSPLDPYGNPPICIPKNSSTWRFLNYTMVLGGTATSGTGNTLTAASIPLTDVTPGKYIIQFTSGTHTGKIRSVASVTSGFTVISWSENLPSAIGAGTTYEIYKANSSILFEVKDSSLPIADNAGTADAIVASYLGAATSLTDNLTVLVVLPNPTTSTAPTFAPNGLAAKPIRDNGGGPLTPGLKGTVILRYEASTDDWRLLNPMVTGASTMSAIDFFIGNF